MPRRRLRRPHTVQHPEIISGCLGCALVQRNREYDWSKRVKYNARPDAWTDEEDERLVQLCGWHTAPEIAAILNDEFHLLDEIVRTVSSIKNRVKHRNLSIWMNGMRVTDIEKIFGVDHRAMKRWWIEPGLLVPARTFTEHGKRNLVNCCFTEDDLERFIRTCPWAYDASSMQRGHRLRQIAEMVQRADPWLTKQDLARWLKSSLHPVDDAMKRGLIPHRRCPGGGPHGQVRIRAADFQGIKEAMEINHNNRVAGARRSMMHKLQCQPGYTSSNKRDQKRTAA